MSWAMIKKAVNSDINKSLDVLIEEKINGVSQTLNEGRVMKAIASNNVKNVFDVKSVYVSGVSTQWTHYGNLQITANGFQNLRVWWSKFQSNIYDCKIVDKLGNIYYEGKFLYSGAPIPSDLNNCYQDIKIWGVKGMVLDIYAKSVHASGYSKVTKVETCFDLVPEDYLI